MGIAYCLVTEGVRDALYDRITNGDASFTVSDPVDHGYGLWKLTILSAKIPDNARRMWQVVFDDEEVRFAEDLDT